MSQLPILLLNVRVLRCHLSKIIHIGVVMGTLRRQIVAMAIICVMMIHPSMPLDNQIKTTAVSPILGNLVVLPHL